MPKQSSAQIARRLIAVLGNFREGGEVSLSELAQQVGVTPAELASELATLPMCGVAPYYPDMMIDVWVEGDTIQVYQPLPAISGPVRLSPSEAEALVAALGAAGFSADDPLTTRLLDAASASFDAEELARTLATGLASHEPGVFEALASAVREHEAVAIAYQREGASEPGIRTVEPIQLLSERGVWYLWAWCRLAGEHRTFRVDRVRGLEHTGERFDPASHATAVAPAVALMTDDLPLARLRFAPGEAFVEREWPGGSVVREDADGSLLADIPFAGTGWLARRVLGRLGRVEVLEPAEMRSAVARLAAEELAAL